MKLSTLEVRMLSNLAVPASAQEFENTLKREFGNKSELALLFAHFSFAQYEGKLPGEVVVISELEACSDEKNPALVRYPTELTPEYLCPLMGNTPLECLLAQGPVRDTLKNVLAPVTVELDEISWDMRHFE
jgi:hypothetical protein